MKSADEFLNIDTPENVGFDYEIAGIGSRFLAALIDTAIMAVAVFGVNFVLLLLATTFDVMPSAAAWNAAIAGLIAFAVIWGYYIYFEVRWNGQSPGKRRIGIRVLRRDGTPVSATESAVRNLVRIVDFMPFAYGVGVVTMFIHEQACRLGDLAASTLVVHERSEITLESLRQSTSMPLMTTPFEESVGSWPLTRLDADDLQLAAEFLQRRYTLVNAPALARAILARMIAKMGVVDESYRQYEPAFVIATILRARPE